MTGIPIRYIRRYSSASGSTSFGTLIMRSSGSAASSPISAITKPPKTANSSAVCTARCAASVSSRPIAPAITTFAPRATPVKRFTTRLTTELFAPTAATAAVRASPAKLPTTARSEALNSCPSIAVAATGSANSGILFHIGPCSISMPLFFISILLSILFSRTGSILLRFSYGKPRSVNFL